MPLSSATMKRLTIVRYLFIQSGEIRNKAGVLSGLSLLSLHDAIELFLQIASEEKHINLDKIDFIGYWAAFEKADTRLTHKEKMKRLNNARVEVKHRGTLPSNSDIEAFHKAAIEFLDTMTPHLFGIDFDDISLSMLVTNDRVRSELQGAEAALKADNLQEALERAARAFKLAFYDHRYGEDDVPYSKRMYDPVDVTGGLDWAVTLSRDSPVDRRFVDAVKDMGEQLGEAITVVAYNLDYHGYRYLKTFGPSLVMLIGGEIITQWMAPPTNDRSIIERCISFATEAVLRLQEK